MCDVNPWLTPTKPLTFPPQSVGVGMSAARAVGSNSLCMMSFRSFAYCGTDWRASGGRMRRVDLVGVGNEYQLRLPETCGATG